MRAPRTERRRDDGVLLLDKPVGLSSNAALQRVRGLFRAERAGHAGTLDPLASGLLLVLVGPSTRLARYFVGLDKRYLTEVELGRRTSTGDAEGEVTVRGPEHVDETALRALAGHRVRYLGLMGSAAKVAQMFAAMRSDGVPADFLASLHAVELLLGQRGQGQQVIDDLEHAGRHASWVRTGAPKARRAPQTALC